MLRTGHFFESMVAEVYFFIFHQSTKGIFPVTNNIIPLHITTNYVVKFLSMNNILSMEASLQDRQQLVKILEKNRNNNFIMLQPNKLTVVILYTSLCHLGLCFCVFERLTLKFVLHMGHFLIFFIKYFLHILLVGDICTFCY